MIQPRSLFQSSIFYFSLIITSVIFLLSLGCTEDPTAPEGGNGEKSEGTVTIGVDGGVIEKGDFKITIPPGAFDGNYDIAVSEIEDDGAFGESTISESYKISGLPNSYSETIKIKVRYTSQLSGNSFIAVGNNVFDEANSDSSFEYNLFEASDSSGFLISEIPGINLGVIGKSTSELNESNSSIDRIIKVISSYKEKRSENFVFHYPIVLESYISNVEKTFEDVFNIISNDLDLSFYPKPEHQTVIIKYLPGDKAIYAWYTLVNGPQQTYFYIDIDSIMQNDLVEVKKRLGNIILSKELVYYANLGEFSKTIKSWAEELFADVEFKYPTNFEEHFMNPFEGLQGYKDSENSHFIGLASILKYLVEDEELFGMKGLKKMHPNTNEDIDPIAALLKSIDGNVVDWLPVFYKKYLSGEIYELPKNSFISNAHYEWNISSVADTLKLFEPNSFYRDLSAKLFKINLNYQPIDYSYDMTLSTGGTNTLDALSLVVFGVQNGETVYLETAHAQDFIIPNLKEYYDNNMRQFLVVLVNGLGTPPYEGSSDIDLSIKINNGTPSNSVYNKCLFESTLQGHYSKTNDVDGLSEYDKQLEIPRTVFSGEFKSGAFIGEWNYSSSTDVTNITLKVVLNTTRDLVKSFEYSYSSQSLDSEYYNELYISIFGFDIPLVEENDEMIKFSISLTSDVCDHISSVEDRSKTWYLNEQRTLLDYSCDEFSEILIQLYNE